MSYFAPDFDNLDYSWYRTTTDDNYASERNIIDTFWDSICDQILIRYVRKYGILYSAFFPDIKSDIEDQKNISFSKIRYYEYYFQNRAMELPEIRKKLTTSCEKTKNITITCELCSNRTRIVDIHPNIIRRQYPPLFCTDCFYLSRPYHAEWNNNIKTLLIDFLTNMGKAKYCDICKKNIS